MEVEWLAVTWNLFTNSSFTGFCNPLQGINVSVSYSNPQEGQKYPVGTIASWTCFDDHKSATCDTGYSYLYRSWVTAWVRNYQVFSQCGKYTFLICFSTFWKKNLKKFIIFVRQNLKVITGPVMDTASKASAHVSAKRILVWSCWVVIKHLNKHLFHCK